MSELSPEEELAQLEAKVEELKKQAEEKRRIIAENKPFEITIESMLGNSIVIKHDYSVELVNYYQTIKGRSYIGHLKANAVPASDWHNIEAEILKIKPKATFTWKDGVKEQFDDYLYAPDFLIDIYDDTEYTIKLSKRGGVSSYGLTEIPGTQFNVKRQVYTSPLTEGWRIFNYFESHLDKPKVVWTDAAYHYTTEQVKRRAELDTIALKQDVELEIPGFIGELRPFQKVGVKFFDLNGSRGICGDEMGLGKTPQMIALALLKGYSVCVVCPATLKVNWTRELMKFAGEVPYILSGSAPTNYDLVHLIKNKPRFVIINYDILGSNTVNKTETKDLNGTVHVKTEVRFPWVDIINLVEFDLMVLDEAHYIKNVESNRSLAARKLKAKHIIGLTGTPVLNRPGELWAILNLIDPETFSSYEMFVRQYTVDKKIARNVKELRELLKPIMIRRLKKDVITELPPLNRINYYSELSDKAKRVYNKAMAGIYQILQTWNPGSHGHEEAIVNMLVKIMRLKQICAIDKVAATADLATSIYDSTGEGERPKKVLIFSQFKPTAYAIKQRLGDEAVGFVDRSASGEFVTVDNYERQKRVDQFQKDENCHFLVVTEKTATEGHNITAAMAVIFNDLFWTPAAHQQAEGRAYMRTGDPHGIDSYYHIISGTIEDYIQELLAAKLNIIEQVVEGVQASRADSSIIGELLDKMKNSMWRKEK